MSCDTPGKTSWMLCRRWLFRLASQRLGRLWRCIAMTQAMLTESPSIAGWWFGTFFIFPIYWEFHHPNWLIFFRGVQTTNQIRFSSFVHGWTRDATKAKCWRASETQRQLPPLCWAWGCWGFTQRTWKDLASSDQSTYSPKMPWSSTTWPHWQPFMPIQELGSPVKLAPLNAFYADTRAKKPCRLLTYSPKMQTTSTAWPHPQTFMQIQEQGRPVGCQPTALNCN